MEYWINIDGVDNGPYTKDEIISLRKKGSISDANMACSVGDSSWSTVGQLFPLQSSPQELPPAPSPPTKPKNKKDVKNILSFFKRSKKKEKQSDEQSLNLHEPVTLVVIRGIDIPVSHMALLILKWLIATLMVSLMLAIIVGIPIWIGMQILGGMNNPNY